jgi:hypothetical protein
MANRTDPNDKVLMSTMSFGDWATAAFALSIGGAAFLFIAFTLFWLAGMPGPKLWYGSGNIPADILEVSITALIATLFINLMGAMAVLSSFWLFRKIRRR